MGWVDPEEGVGIGPARVRFEGVEAGRGGNPTVSLPSWLPTLTEVRLEYDGEEHGRETYQVGRALVLIGRSPACRVRLAGPEVGRVHAAIVRTPAGAWVVDLLGPGGVTVGGMPTRSGRLEDGDEIGLGDRRIRVRIGRAARPSGRKELARSPSNRGMRPASDGDGPSGRPGTGAGGQVGAGRELAATPDATTARLLEEFDRMHRRTTEQFQQAVLMMFRMHQDQMDLFREELSRLDRLEDEQRSLRAELALGGPSRPPLEAPRPAQGGAAPPPSLDGPRPARASPRPGGRPAVAPAPPAAVRARVEDDPHPDPHSRLSSRLAEIQDERQGLWKRLLGSLTGGEAGRVLP